MLCGVLCGGAHGWLQVEEDPEDCSKVSAVVVHRAQVYSSHLSTVFSLLLSASSPLFLCIIATAAAPSATQLDT